ncbi:SHOCT domain-containing protein [Agromyces atrinae]|uniref:Membrane protease subunit (Stomatin/prohibitin family) n=1 Tax=Agromyces atrinae TaxID=592376 RepID=A0A4Q2MCL0_9MICO|nr:SHOCT domain-containing protein [Agromyces atrinae]NYD68003.1 membrane protease subunit (stomatin/prohibitin family) [Agromyces atrinae]RXZ87841.1 SHOCT domain-containing protein [Agromyces atrinae]
MPLFRRVGRPGLIGLAARTAVVAGTATAVSGGMARRQQSRAAEQAEAAAYEQQQYAQAPAPAAAAPAAGGVDIVAELQKLGALHQQGLLDDAEFAAAKARLLG